MKLPKISSRAVAILTIAVAIIGLVMSPVSAAPAPAPTGNPGGMYWGNPATHHGGNSTQQAARLQAVLTNLSQQGVDVSPAQADITTGNMTAAVQWLMAYHKENPGVAISSPRPHGFNATQPRAFNSTQMTSRLQTVLTNLGQQGINVTQALADLATGNLKGVMQDLMAIHTANPGVSTGFPQPHAFNSTQMTSRLQAGITRLGQQGVDVSQVQADLTSGNLTAAMQWMTAYHKAHPATPNNRTAWKGSNSTQWQKGGSFRPHTAGSGNQTGQHSWFPARARGA